MRQSIVVFFSLILLSCSNDDDNSMPSNVLAEYLMGQVIETGAVIACAASEENTNNILAYYFPRAGATSIRFYETETASVDKLDYTKYKEIALESEPFFNGSLGKFTREASVEKWIIITYELNNEIKVSNPIRTKQIQKPTVWNDEVTIDQTNPLMPIFNWELNAVADNAIYFQVISSINNDLISGTYTLENTFQFYNLSNVVLNITEGVPQLENTTDYNFTLMDVSLDNWVNIITIDKKFTTQ